MRAVTNWRRPSALSPALLATIAVVGVGVLALVLLLLINLASGSPAPTTTPGGSLPPGASPATAQPTDSLPSSKQPTNGTDAPPTDSPLTPPPTPDGSLTPEQALLTHVPEQIRASCTVEPGRSPVVLTARCTADDGALTINYYEYDTAEDMAGEYAELRGGSQIEPNTGRCEEPNTWPAESEYGVGGQITGRRLCTDQPGTPTIYWTDDRLNILGQAVAESAAVERLIEFWTNESGPIP